ncbi:L-amino acid N-acyltransferase YncA [Geodermatophilus obscurus]|uniref:L-amino acid N-acyltransferase YncA n=1 Tax=Geodermatophilus obscurus TaxID=1861 RepID=A0A1I5H896_9ACTN|nr:GNAT family N-acetyltransferase [Geodermatophilus obscurus]SFO44548.1 L-amino acid N-acyltransferase YncA [Geodermatophilus obscurus]
MDPLPPFPRLTGTAEVSVRPAVPADAGDVARVQETAWRAMAEAALPAAVLDAWDTAAATESWRSAITSPPTPGHGVLVAVDDGRVVGFAAYGPAELGPDDRPHPAGPTTELAVLLVEPRWGRRGHGSRLLAAAADLTRSTGTARLQTWVADADTVTGRFLESAGWDRDGWVRTLDAGGTPLREVRWHALLEEAG